MKREEPVQPLSRVQDWPIEERKDVHTIQTFSHREMGKLYFPKDFPTLKSKDDVKHQNVLWKHCDYKITWRSLSDLKSNPEVWVLPCSLSLSQTPWCSMILFSCSREAWKSQDVTNQSEQTVWAGSLQETSGPSSFECLMLLCDLWNRLRRHGTQQQTFHESKTRFSFLCKTVKIVISFWMKCRGWGFVKKKNRMKWDF